jgi:hypothetical protein
LETGEIFWTLRELMSTGRDEFFGSDAEVLSGSEIRGFDDVEGEERMDAADHVVGRVTGRPADSGPFGPEDLREDLSPLSYVASTSLYDGFTNVKVF